MFKNEEGRNKVLNFLYPEDTNSRNKSRNTLVNQSTETNLTLKRNHLQPLDQFLGNYKTFQETDKINPYSDEYGQKRKALKIVKLMESKFKDSEL